MALDRGKNIIELYRLMLIIQKSIKLQGNAKTSNPLHDMNLATMMTMYLAATLDSKITTYKASYSLLF